MYDTQVARGRHAIDVGSDACNGVVTDAGDAIANILHAVQAEGEDPWAAHDLGQHHFDAELEEAPGGPPAERSIKSLAAEARRHRFLQNAAERDLEGWEEADELSADLNAWALALIRNYPDRTAAILSAREGSS